MAADRDFGNAFVPAGTVASFALTLVLLSFGACMGFSVVSPKANAGISAMTSRSGGAVLHRPGDDLVRHRGDLAGPSIDAIDGDGSGFFAR